MYIFLYGADTFRSSEKLNSIKKKYLEKDSSGSSLSVLDFEENNITINQFKDSLSAQGLFSSKKLIILKNSILSQTPEKQKELLEFLKKNPSNEENSNNLLVFFEAGSPKKNGALYKFLFSNAKKQEFLPLEGPRLANWALNYLNVLDRTKTIEKGALELLIASTGNDLYLLSNEISKLANFKISSENITVFDVELLVKSRIDSTVFQTIEALTGGNKARALALLHEQIENGEDVFYLLSMYVYQIRTLLKIGDCFWNGTTAPFQIAQVTKLHPYVIQKSLAQLRNLSEEKVKNIFRQLADIDRQAKSGKINPIQALDAFIVSI